MAGRSPVTASEEQKTQLEALAASRDRGEADRARAILLTLAGWTSAQIAEVFRVREDTVRFWRGGFLRGGVETLKASVYAGPPPVKTEAALRVVTPLLETPVADRPNWTIPRLIAEIKRQERVTISRSQLSKALRKKLQVAAAPTYAEKPPARGGDRTGGAQAPAAQGTSGSRRHRPVVRRRERGADASLSGPRVG